MRSYIPVPLKKDYHLLLLEPNVPKQEKEVQTNSSMIWKYLTHTTRDGVVLMPSLLLLST